VLLIDWYIGVFNDTKLSQMLNVNRTLRLDTGTLLTYGRPVFLVC